MNKDMHTGIVLLFYHSCVIVSLTKSKQIYINMKLII